METRSTADSRLACQRGFGLADLMVGVAIGSAFLLAVAASFGARPGHAHGAALALEAALAEARSLAMTTGDVTDTAFPTGATVVVAPDPTVAGSSLVAVYHSRPIPNPNSGSQSFPLPIDTGFPVMRVAATFVVQNGGGPPSGDAFAILISTSGYASIAAPYTYDSEQPVLLTSDPGCNDSGVSIAVTDGVRPETHPFACRDGSYDVSTTI